MSKWIKEINTMLEKAPEIDLVVIKAFIKGYLEGRYIL